MAATEKTPMADIIEFSLAARRERGARQPLTPAEYAAAWPTGPIHTECPACACGLVIERHSDCLTITAAADAAPPPAMETPIETPTLSDDDLEEAKFLADWGTSSRGNSIRAWGTAKVTIFRDRRSPDLFVWCVTWNGEPPKYSRAKFDTELAAKVDAWRELQGAQP
jgi:hypothetical protein